MKRVTGLGGVFFRCSDTAAQQGWYKKHLGIPVEAWGGWAIPWRDNKEPDKRGYTVWSTFKDDTEYFGRDPKQFMINYRVADLVGLIAALKEEGVQVAGEIEQHENGKFAWIVDPEGTRIELWEPVPHDNDPYLPADEG